jgi:4-alpha-glucanotransferase
MAIFRGSGCRIIAEDLGTVPDYVRQSLARLGVPGFKVLHQRARDGRRRQLDLPVALADRSHRR